MSEWWTYRLSDFLMVLAYASDLATGHSRDFALKSCVVAMRIAKLAKLDPLALALAALAADAHAPLATSCLQPWSRWVTPVGVPKRFDTLFFVAGAPDGQEPRPDEGETVTLEWVAPAVALAADISGAPRNQQIGRAHV